MRLGASFDVRRSRGKPRACNNAVFAPQRANANVGPIAPCRKRESVSWAWPATLRLGWPQRSAPAAVANLLDKLCNTFRRSLGGKGGDLLPRPVERLCGTAFCWRSCRASLPLRVEHAPGQRHDILPADFAVTLTSPSMRHCALSFLPVDA